MELVQCSDVKEAFLLKKRTPTQQAIAFPFAVFYGVWSALYIASTLRKNTLLHETQLLVLYLAVFLHIVFFLLARWSYRLRCFISFQKTETVSSAETVLVVPVLHKGKAEFCALQHSQTLNAACFVFQKRKFIFNKETKTFERRGSRLEGDYSKYKKQTGLVDGDVKHRQEECGKNVFDIPAPSFIDLFQEHIMSPFFTFQVFCVLLWVLDDYWYNGLFTLFMLVAFEAAMVQQRLTTLMEFRTMEIEHSEIEVRRDGAWVAVRTSELVPGDVGRLLKKKGEDLAAPCDAVLIEGSCVVNEAMISGESTPLAKEACPDEGCFSGAGEDRRHMLFSGTQIVFVGEEECRFCVLRTGFHTVQGSLVRTMVFSSETAGPHNKEALFLILFLTFFAVCAAGYVWAEGVKNPDRKRFKLLVECLLIVTTVIPPELPIEMSLVVNQALATLAAQGIVCTEPFRIPLGGKTKVCCLDKTGTITEETLVFEGVFSEKGRVGEVDEKTERVMGACHELVQVDGEIGGDPMEKELFAAAGWEVAKKDEMLCGNGKRVQIVKRAPFSSSQRRMSALCKDSSGYFVVSKGAPEAVRAFLDTVPEFFDDVFAEHAGKGKRVIAMGMKRISSKKEVDCYLKDGACALCGVEFCGFAVFSAAMKRDSKSAIENLTASGHRVVIVTGDSGLTANHVAREVGLVGAELCVVEKGSRGDGSFVLTGDTEGTVLFSELEEAFPPGPLSVSGDAFSELLSVRRALSFRVLSSAAVLFRCSPKQKEELMVLLKENGVVSLMCGDGTNDVGALKQADVGVALLDGDPDHLPRILAESRKRAAKRVRKEMEEANEKMRRALNLAEAPAQTHQLNTDDVPRLQFGDASVAAAFTSRISTLDSVCNVIREGRSSLVTTAQMFKILALNSVVSAFSMSVLNLDGIRYGDRQSTMAGVLLSASSFFLTRSKSRRKLSRKRPLERIVSPLFILSPILQSAVHFFVLKKTMLCARRFSFTSSANDAEFVPSLMNTAVFISSLYLQVSTVCANYIGHPFKQNITENTRLCSSLAATAVLAVLLSFGAVSELETLFELTKMPMQLRATLLFYGLADIALCYSLENVLKKIE
ncbi:MAG: P-type ATPase [Amphiamblys sp. WSBS2006]|nr:MAG: P-type ATPase [Amphiamblys sp. WSBS2006]